MPGQEQYYQKHIFCCDNERPAGHPRGCCKERGGEALRNYLKARVKEEGLAGDIRVNKAGCLDRCEMGAVMVIYPEGAWYTCASKEDVDEIIERHLKKGERVERLLLGNTQKELTPEQAENRAANCGC